MQGSEQRNEFERLGIGCNLVRESIYFIRVRPEFELNIACLSTVITPVSGPLLQPKSLKTKQNFKEYKTWGQRCSSEVEHLPLILGPPENKLGGGLSDKRIKCIIKGLWVSSDCAYQIPTYLCKSPSRCCLPCCDTEVPPVQNVM